MPSMGELVVILVIVLVLFGANKLPGIGDALGRSIRNFKKASTPDDPKIEDETKGSSSTKQVTAGGSKKQIAAGDEDDAEWEEVVVRRKKKKEA